jgi:exonuclease SbcD
MPIKRLLHTSDWHLGQLFHDHERGWEHQQFLDWLVETVREREIDALLITGDIFDTANPPISAQRQWFDLLGRLRRARPACSVVAIAGNHDSGHRLDASDALVRALDLHVIGSPRDAEGRFDPERLVVPLGSDAHGGVWGYAAAMPFLRADDLGTLTQLQEDDAFVTLSRARFDAVFAALARRAGPGHARLALAHGVITGSTPSESERDVRIGNVGGLPVDVFPEDLTYVALGHLHRPQRAGGRDHVQYAGSPLPLHVSEAEYPFRAVLVEIEGGALVGRESIAVPQRVPVVRVPAKGAPSDPDAVLAALRALPASGVAAPEQQPFIEVRYLVTGPRPSFAADVRAALEGKGYRLTTIRDERRAAPAAATEEAGDTPRNLDDITPEEVFRSLYARTYPDKPEPDPDVIAAFLELVRERQEATKERA